jgi:dolichol kinase
MQLFFPLLCVIFVVGIQFFITSPYSNLLFSTEDASFYHLRRKLQHATSGIAIILCYNSFLSVEATIYTLIAVESVFLALHYYRLKNPGFNQKFTQQFQALLRPHEFNQIPGAFFMLLGCLNCLLLRHYFAELVSLQLVNAVMLFCTIGDPTAGFIGRYFSYKNLNKTLYKGKSIMGSLAMLFCCAMISLLALNVSTQTALLYGLVGAVWEFFGLLDDNYSVPVMSLLSISALQFYNNKLA